jgi:hypothetical protein
MARYKVSYRRSGWNCISTTVLPAKSPTEAKAMIIELDKGAKYPIVRQSIKVTKQP